MLNWLLKVILRSRRDDMVGQHILVRPDDLSRFSDIQKLRDAVSKAHKLDDDNWVVHDLRGERFQSHTLNSISGRQKSGLERWTHHLVIIDQDFSVQASIDASRAKSVGVTIAMVAQRPRSERLVDTVRFSQVSRYFPMQAIRNRRGGFWFLEFDEPELQRPSTRTPRRRERPTRGERAYAIRHHDW